MHMYGTDGDNIKMALTIGKVINVHIHNRHYLCYYATDNHSSVRAHRELHNVMHVHENSL